MRAPNRRSAPACPARTRGAGGDPRTRRSAPALAPLDARPATARAAARYGRPCPAPDRRSSSPRARRASRADATSASPRSRCPSPATGEVLVRNTFMSVDPYMRGRMNDRQSYVPPFQLDAPLDGGAVGEVVASRADGLAEGDTVAAPARLARVRGARRQARARKVDADAGAAAGATSACSACRA